MAARLKPPVQGRGRCDVYRASPHPCGAGTIGEQRGSDRRQRCRGRIGEFRPRRRLPSSGSSSMACTSRRDDQPHARRVLAMVLESVGAVVTTTDSARAAVEALLTERPNVLVSDLGMPAVGQRQSETSQAKHPTCLEGLRLRLRSSSASSRYRSNHKHQEAQEFGQRCGGDFASTLLRTSSPPS